MATVFDFIGSGAPTTWCDNADAVKLQPGDAADATRPDIWRYEGLKWVASLGPDGEPGFTLMDSYGTDWRFGRIRFSDIGTIPAVDGDVWDATRGRMVQRHIVDAGVVDDAYGLFGAGYDLLEPYSGDQRADTGQMFVVTLYDAADTETNFEVSILTASGTSVSDLIPFSDILDKYVEFDTRWQCSTTTSSADGYVSVRMRTSDDGETWTDLGVVVESLNVNIATAGVNRSGATVYGMSVCIGEIGIPGGFYYATLYDSDVVATTPDMPTDESAVCCASDAVEGSGVAGPGAGVDRSVETIPDWTARLTGGATNPDEPDLTDAEDWSDS